MLVLATPHRFTVEEYHKMADTGILTEDDRVELIEGEIVDMSPIGRRHAACVALLNDVFGANLRGRVVIWPQNPLRISEQTEPQPDLVLLRWRSDYYAGADPLLDDVLLVIEVADSSLAYDRDFKTLLYARAGIPEVWVVDLNGRRVIVCRDPGPDGYRDIVTYQGNDRFSPLTFPDFALSAEQVVG